MQRECHVTKSERFAHAKVGQNHTYGAYPVILAGKPNIRSYTVYIMLLANPTRAVHIIGSRKGVFNKSATSQIQSVQHPQM